MLALLFHESLKMKRNVPVEVWEVKAVFMISCLRVAVALHGHCGGSAATTMDRQSCYPF